MTVYSKLQQAKMGPSVIAVALVVLCVSPEAAADDGAGWQPLLWTQVGLLVVVGILGPLYAAWRTTQDDTELRGLNLPRGSVRSMMALIIVGSFVNVLVFGKPIGQDTLQMVIPAFAALSGSVIGFYFGERTATPKPGEH